MEKTIEKLLFASRWILAPVYLGMSLALVALGIKFFQELYHLLTDVAFMAEADMVLMLLALVDMVLVGSLIVMVMFSGYENFVSALDVDDRHREAELAGQARRQLAQAQGRIVHRRDLIDSSVARLHGNADACRTRRHADVVRHHPSDVCRLGGNDGRARSDYRQIRTAVDDHEGEV